MSDIERQHNESVQARLETLRFHSIPSGQPCLTSGVRQPYDLYH